MVPLAQKLYSKYHLLARMLFLSLIFGVLSFGRAFSVINIKVLSLPVFIIEIVLLSSLPLVISNGRELLKIPPLFLKIALGYFLFGFFYLLCGFSESGLFAIRDFVFLCSYLLFLPLTFICFKSLKAIKSLFFIIVFANVIALLVGKILIFGAGPSCFHEFISKAKTFQIGIVYGISSSFLLVFYDYFKNKTVRLFILLLASINLYMLIIFGERSLWVAVICLVVFLMLILGFRVMVKVYFKLLVCFLLVGSVLFYFNFMVFKSPRLEILMGRCKSTARVFTKEPGLPSSFIKQDKLTIKDRAETEGDANIIWRVKIWRQTIEFASNSYLFGRGFGRIIPYDIWGYQKPHSAFTDSKIIPAHNYLLTVFYKMGLLGLVLVMFINIYIFYYAIRHLKRCNSEFIRFVLVGALGALVFWYTMAMFFDVVDSPPTSIFLWIFMGLIFAAVEIDKCQKSEFVV